MRRRRSGAEFGEEEGGNVALHQAGISILLLFPEDRHTPTPLCPPFTTHTLNISQGIVSSVVWVYL